jgi:hypothetical protein
VKQRIIIRAKRGKKPAIRNAKNPRKDELRPRRIIVTRKSDDDPRDLDDERAWMDW